MVAAEDTPDVHNNIRQRYQTLQPVEVRQDVRFRTAPAGHEPGHALDASGLRAGTPCYTCLMAARRFILFVLTIFALQLSWSAVAAYCSHETGRAAQHFGHHSSENDSHKLASAEKEKSSGVTKKTAVHSHCSACAHAVLSLDGLPATAFFAALGNPVPPVTSHRYSSSDPDRPERPQWNSAV